jgi:hypothetical protein
MALKFGRGIRTVKTEDPITGARIKDPQVYGKKTEYGTVSSWPEVREMYKAGKLKGTFEGRKTNPAIMEYLSGNVDVLSDKEFDEPILGISGNEKGQFTSLISNFKPGGKQYTALSKKQSGYGLPKLEAGQAYGFDAGNTIADYTSARGGAGASVGTDLETFRKTDPVQKKDDTGPLAPSKDFVVDNTDDGVRTPSKKVNLVKGKLIVPKEKEDLTWDAPNFVKAKGVRVPQTKIKTSGKSGIEGGGKKKNVGGTPGSRIKYNTESRQSMAYFSGNTSIGDKITGKTESELRDLKKETRGEAGRMLKEGRLGDALTIGKDLSTIRKATRYAKKGEVYTASDGSIAEGQESTLKYFTPEKTKRMSQDGKIVRNDGAMAGYRDFKNQEAEKAFRAQYENATNRNTTWDRIQSPSEGASNSPSTQSNRAQQKAKFAAANPTATPGQIRRGGRDLQKADELLMKKVDKEIIK